jgi:hypothetical protein
MRIRSIIFSIALLYRGFFFSQKQVATIDTNAVKHFIHKFMKDLYELEKLNVVELKDKAFDKWTRQNIKMLKTYIPQDSLKGWLGASSIKDIRIRDCIITGYPVQEHSIDSIYTNRKFIFARIKLKNWSNDRFVSYLKIYKDHKKFQLMISRFYEDYFFDVFFEEKDIVKKR